MLIWSFTPRVCEDSADSSRRSLHSAVLSSQTVGIFLGYTRCAVCSKLGGAHCFHEWIVIYTPSQFKADILKQGCQTGGPGAKRGLWYSCVCFNWCNPAG